MAKTVTGVSDDVRERGDARYERAEPLRNGPVHLSEARRRGWVAGRDGQRDRPRSQHFIRAALKVLPNNCQAALHRRSYKDIFKGQ